MGDSSKVDLAWLARVLPARPRVAVALLVAFGALMALAAPGLGRLELRMDGRSLVPADDPVLREDRRIRDHFGLADPVVLYLATDHPDGLFNPTTLALVQTLSERAAALPWTEPGQVTSLATEPRDRVDSFDLSPFLEPLPESAEELAALADDLAAVPIFHGVLVAESADGPPRGAAVVVGLPDGSPGDGSSRESHLRDLFRLAREVETPTDRIVVVGAPVVETLLGRHVLGDLAVLLPAVLVLVAGVLWVGCRRIWCVILGLAEVGFCLVVTFGLMGWVGVPIYLTTVILPVILTAVGLTDEIHLLLHLQRRLTGSEALDEARWMAGALETTMAALGRPLVLTSVTTALGFLSFTLSDLPQVRAFGLFAALGVAACLSWTLIAMPAALSLLSPARLVRPERDGRGSWLDPAVWGKRLRALVAAAAGSRRETLWVLGLALVLAGWGVARLEVQDGWVENFSPSSSLRHATEQVDDALLGTHVLLVELSFERAGDVPTFDDLSGPLLDPRRVEAIAGLEEAVRPLAGVGGVRGLPDQLRAMAFLTSGRREGSEVLPTEAWGVRRLLNRLLLVRGARRDRVIDRALERTVVTIFLERADFQRTARVMEVVDREVAARLAPLGGSHAYGGDVAVSQAMIPAIVRTQVVSVWLALLGAFLALLAFERSLRFATKAVVPASAATLGVMGFMGWVGMPLGVATSMFAAVTLGLGIDFSVHFLSAEERARRGGSSSPNLSAVAEVGPAFALDLWVLGGGFGLLMISRVPTVARLGLVVVVALVAAAVATSWGLGTARSRPAERSQGSTHRSTS